MLTGTWSPRGAHGYVIGVAIGVRCELKVKLGMQKAAAGDLIKAQKGRPRCLFPEPGAARLKVQVLLHDQIRYPAGVRCGRWWIK